MVDKCIMSLVWVAVFFRFSYVKTAEQKGKDLLLQIFGNPIRVPAFTTAFISCDQSFYQFGKRPSFKRTKLKLIGYTFQNLHSGWCQRYLTLVGAWIRKKDKSYENCIFSFLGFSGNFSQRQAKLEVVKIRYQDFS